MPRFVILEHDYPELHWDFMLEKEGVLKTWKLSVPPRVGQLLTAELSFDHRLIYLDYEGPISDNRGSVVCWDRGTFTWEQESEDRLRVHLRGQCCLGIVELNCLTNNEWRLTLTNGAVNPAWDRSN